MPYRLYQEEKQKAVNILNEVKMKLYNKGWFPATSGNLSYKLHDDPLYFAKNRRWYGYPRTHSQ